MRYIIIGIFVIVLIIAVVLLINALFPRPAQIATIPLTPTPIITPVPQIGIGGSPPTLTPIPTPTSTPTLPPIPTPTPLPQTIPPVLIPTVRVFQGTGFSLSFPANWGILTCNNSPNFEFDPLNNTDFTGVTCSIAQKPITVLVQNSLANCTGTLIQIGNIQVLKSTTIASNFTTYQWCTLTSPVLNITHRTSPIPSNVATAQNFSSDIEAIISTITFPS